MLAVSDFDPPSEPQAMRPNVLDGVVDGPETDAVPGRIECICSVAPFVRLRRTRKRDGEWVPNSRENRFENVVYRVRRNSDDRVLTGRPL
jgi:hypothetical protein